MRDHDGFDRRALLRLGAALAAGSVLTGCSAAATEHEADAAEEESHEGAITAEQALERLKHGNARFVAGNAQHPGQTRVRRGELAAGQQPIATVLSCVDSRVPPELVFDEGLGELFVARSAGQALDKALVGSLQFGVHELHIPLLVVLGHSKCGAVKATIEAVQKNAPATGTDIDALVTAIKPAVESASGAGDVLATTVRENVKNVVKKLSGTPVLSTAVAEKRLTIVGAVYDLDSGKVAFL
jgi:carbonic anhydrase